MQRQLMQSKKQLMQLQKETWNNSGLMGFEPWPFQYWCSSLTSRVIKPTENSWSLKWFVISGLSLSGRGWDFPGCYDHGPRLLSKENRKKKHNQWQCPPTCCIYLATWNLSENPKYSRERWCDYCETNDKWWIYDTHTVIFTMMKILFDSSGH